jgi:hypothetical protein
MVDWASLEPKEIMSEISFSKFAVYFPSKAHNEIKTAKTLHINTASTRQACARSAQL